MKTIQSFIGALAVCGLLSLSGCGGAADNTTVNPKNPVASPQNAEKVKFEAPKVEAKEGDGNN